MKLHRTVQFRRPIILILLALAPVHLALAQDPQQGRQIAETWCSNCHLVSSRQPHGFSTGAPSFTAIAEQTVMTSMALRAFLQTPHDRMPDLHLSRKEIDDLISYIQSLRVYRP